jgi:hypothetical protein
MSVRSFVGSHRKLVSALVVLAVGLGVFAVLWFEPQKLFQNKTVKEAAPNPSASTPTGSGTPADPATTPSEPTVGPYASGDFRSLEHNTTGTASLIRLDDGSYVLRFENLDTSNGPDLRVYLSELPSTLGWHDYGERYLELGELKGNRGDQNYPIPKGTDLSKYQSAVIWCVRFKVGFGVAPLYPLAD